MPIFKSWDSLSCFQTQKFPKFGHLGNSLLNKVYCFQAAVHKIEPAKMSSSMTSQSPYSKARSKHSDRVVFQTVVDAKLHADFDESASNFDYSSSIRISSSSDKNQEPRSDRVTTTYLHQTQKGKLIQPFGCLLALDDNTFKVIAYSDNAPEMLTLTSHAVPSVGDYPYVGIGTEITAIFTSPSASALHKALRFADVSILNPILVHCKASQKPFYAIIHRVTGSLIVDLEPVKPYDVPMIAAGALQSYKLAAKAINRLQSLPSGDMEMLCNTMVQEVFELTGYDRVMAYKFHEDDHGEVVAEAKKSGLDPYLGLHYPATDIPQASRFLFMKNKVRMICDCRERNVKVIQDEKLPFDLTFCGSTLRAPHGCHLQYMENMDSIASLVMVVDEGDDEPQKRKRLWGLVVCHHTSPRFVPFPLRYACEFLAQVFAIHINKELELERQILEKNVLRTQTLLCDMLMRDAPFGIVTQNPNIMDLVKCDGAALLYNDDIFRLGAAPAEFQLRDIASWLLENHMDSTGLSTDSLYDAGYPGALALGNSVCGMACVKIATNHLLFWFRAHTAAEIKWGGAKQEDDGTKMHPRSSFRTFLDVVKNRSVPWKEFEVDAIYSLQLIVRNAQSDVNTSIIHSRINNLNLDGLPRLEVVADEMVRLIETANVPIFSVDAHGLINGWNSKISELTGLSVDEALGNHLITIVEGLSVAVVKRMLDLALQGKEEKNVQFEMERRDDAEQRPISLVVNACVRRDVNENIVGVCFVAQDITNQKTVMDKFTRIEGDYKAIVQNPNPLIPPIFGSDEFGWCSEWNPAMAHLSGWDRDDIMDKMMLGEVFGTPKACCRLKNREAFVSLGVVLSNALSGRESDKVPFGFFTRDLRFVECLLCVTKRHGGVFCFLQLASHELQQALHVQRMAEQTALKRLKALAYLKRQIKNPLSGIMFSSKMLEVTDLDQQQKKLLETSSHCQRQLIKILDDSDVDIIIDGYLELETVEFVLYDAVIASLSQATLKSKEKGIKMAHYWSEEVMLETLYGDRLRLQQILADFLMLSVTMTQPGGHVGIQVCRTKERLGGSVYVARVEFRISYSGHGVPEELRDPLFEGEGGASEEEGISLVISRKLVKLMSGDVQSLREAGRSTFIISVELGVANKPRI